MINNNSDQNLLKKYNIDKKMKRAEKRENFVKEFMAKMEEKFGEKLEDKPNYITIPIFALPVLGFLSIVLASEIKHKFRN